MKNPDMEVRLEHWCYDQLNRRIAVEVRDTSKEYGTDISVNGSQGLSIDKDEDDISVDEPLVEYILIS